jgi:hypothetical protein
MRSGPVGVSFGRLPEMIRSASSKTLVVTAPLGAAFFVTLSLASYSGAGVMM